MSYTKHEIVAVVLWAAQDVAAVRAFVEPLPPKFRSLFAFIPAVTNGDTTIVMGSDGSHEGWDTSDIGDGVRANFLKLLQAMGGRGVHVQMPEDGPAEMTETASKYYDERSWLPVKGT